MVVVVCKFRRWPMEVEVKAGGVGKVGEEGYQTLKFRTPWSRTLSFRTLLYRKDLHHQRILWGRGTRNQSKGAAP